MTRRTVTITQVNGEPWFVIADVCKVLGIQNPSDQKKRLDQADLDSIYISSGGQKRNALAVNESGLYDVILDSRKPEALQNTPAGPI